MVDRGVAGQGRHTGGRPEARGEVVIRRTPTGWRVEGSFPALPTDTVDDLGHALTLADLLADGTVPGPRPPRPADGLNEVTRLRSSVRQLEHALSSRVIVEQAIGVLSERWRVPPRDAFEQLRRVTRSHGLRIHDLAKLVIASSTDPSVALPPELVPIRKGEPPVPRQSPDPHARTGAAEPERRERRTRRPGPEPVPEARRAEPVPEARLAEPVSEVRRPGPESVHESRRPGPEPVHESRRPGPEPVPESRAVSAPAAAAPAPASVPAQVPATAPAPRAPHGRHARVER